jgi:hypothetical protein
MGYSWLGERMAEEHRRDLSILSGAADQASGDPAAVAYDVLLPGIGSGTHPLAERHPIGQHVGTLLIRVGTRLGGASIRTS